MVGVSVLPYRSNNVYSSDSSDSKGYSNDKRYSKEKSYSSEKISYETVKRPSSDEYDESDHRLQHPRGAKAANWGAVPIKKVGKRDTDTQTKDTKRKIEFNQKSLLRQKRSKYFTITPRRLYGNKTGDELVAHFKMMQSIGQEQGW